MFNSLLSRLLGLILLCSPVLSLSAQTTFSDTNDTLVSCSYSYVLDEYERPYVSGDHARLRLSIHVWDKYQVNIVNASISANATVIGDTAFFNIALPKRFFDPGNDLQMWPQICPCEGEPYIKLSPVENELDREFYYQQLDRFYTEISERMEDDSLISESKSFPADFIRSLLEPIEPSNQYTKNSSTLQPILNPEDDRISYADMGTIIQLLDNRVGYREDLMYIFSGDPGPPLMSMYDDLLRADINLTISANPDSVPVIAYMVPRSIWKAKGGMKMTKDKDLLQEYRMGNGQYTPVEVMVQEKEYYVFGQFPGSKKFSKYIVVRPLESNKNNDVVLPINE